MKVFNRRNVLKGGLVGSMAAGFASFVGASHAAEPAAKAPAQNNKNTYDVIVLGAGPAGLVTAIAAKQAGAKKVVVFEKRDRPDGNAIFALGSVCGWGSRHQKEQGIKDTADDFYAAFDRDILIKTKFCSVRAFQDKALLRSDLFGELVFMDGTRCSVDTVYVRKRLRWGTHKVTVTREEEGIYSLAGSETLLFASRCSTLALRDEAVLEMQDSLSGILHLHGGTCRVEGVFEAISY